METNQPDRSVPSSRLYAWYLGSVITWAVGSIAVRHASLPDPARTAVAIAAVLPMALTALSFHRLLVRDLDEMLQRVVLEGVAFAFITLMPIVALYVNLKSAGVHVPRLDPPELVLFPALLVGAGGILAWRRYQ